MGSEMCIRDRYKTARAISKVVNEIVRKVLSGKQFEEVRKLLREKPIVEISTDEFHRFRKELSKRFEE